MPSRPLLSRRDFVRAGLAASLTPVLGGCGGGSDPLAFAPPGGNPRLLARPGTPGIAPTIGTSALGLEPTRDGLLYVPQAYDPARAWPLFVALHGSGSSADGWRGFFQAGDTRGMVILVPESRARTWDVIHGDYGPDVFFIDRALTHTFERCRIDPARITLGGFSDGASYALSLGVSNGDLFGRLTAFSPGFFAPHHERAGKPKVFISHGTDDRILPVTATREGIVPTLRDDGHDVTYREFTGGHEVPSDIVGEALDWFLSCRRDGETARRRDG